MNSHNKQPPTKLVILALMGPLLLLYLHTWLYPWVFEDSFIFYRYADNWAKGLGPVFNAGERVEGYTSFLWLLCLTLTQGLTGAVDRFGSWLSFVMASGCVLMTFALARRCLRSFWLALGAACLCAAKGSFALYAASGMESTCFALLVLAAIWVLFFAPGTRLDPLESFSTPAQQPPPSHHWQAGLLLGGISLLAALCRPEAIAYVLLLLCLCLWLRTPGTTAIAAAVFGVGYGAFLLWRQSYYGFPFPNTYYAKLSDRPLSDIWIGVAYIEKYLISHLGLIGLVGLIWACLRQRTWAICMLLFVCGNLSIAVAVHGDIFAHFRFLLPTIPLICIGTMALFERWQDLVRDKEAPTQRLHQGLQIGIVTVMISFLVGTAFLSPVVLLGQDTWRGSAHSYVQTAHRFNMDYIDIAHWMKRQLPPQTTLALNAVGIIPYYTKFQTIDMLGLTDKHIAHSKLKRVKGAVMGHEKHDPAYVLSRRPDIIIPALPVCDRRPPQMSQLQRRWYHNMLPGDRKMLQMKAFQENYQVVVVQVAKSRFTAFFIRKDRLAWLVPRGRKQPASRLSNPRVTPPKRPRQPASRR